MLASASRLRPSSVVSRHLRNIPRTAPLSERSQCSSRFGTHTSGAGSMTGSSDGCRSYPSPPPMRRPLFGEAWSDKYMTSRDPSARRPLTVLTTLNGSERSSKADSIMPSAPTIGIAPTPSQSYQSVPSSNNRSSQKSLTASLKPSDQTLHVKFTILPDGSIHYRDPRPLLGLSFLPYESSSTPGCLAAWKVDQAANTLEKHIKPQRELTVDGIKSTMVKNLGKMKLKGQLPPGTSIEEMTRDEVVQAAWEQMRFNRDDGDQRRELRDIMERFNEVGSGSTMREGEGEGTASTTDSTGTGYRIKFELDLDATDVPDVHNDTYLSYRSNQGISRITSALSRASIGATSDIEFHPNSKPETSKVRFAPPAATSTATFDQHLPPISCITERTVGS